MLATTALILVTLGGGANMRAPTPRVVPPLALDGVSVGAGMARGFGLHSEVLGEFSGVRLGRSLLAQTATSTTPPATTAATTPPAATPAGAAGAGEGSACGEQCDIDCETCRESDRQARYVTRRRAVTLRTHRAFALAAWGSLVVTEALGTMLAINQQTWFGRGNCRAAAEDMSQTRIFGPDFGCGGGLLALHETFAFLTVGLYTTAGVIAVTAPDPDHESVGDGTQARTLRLHKTLAYVHAAGMILMPILGILSIHPELFLDQNSPSYGDNAQSFTSSMRSIHTIVGFATLGALTAALITEF